MKRALLSLFILILSLPAFAQLTQQQKLADFNALAALYDRQYAPYEFNATSSASIS